MLRTRLHHPDSDQSGFTTSGLCQQWYRQFSASRKTTRSARLSLRSAGFTIVELMIATLVFSVILVIITAGIIAITKTYYKGVTLNRTQNVARSVMDSVSQAVQFSGDSILWSTPGSDGLGRGCIGSTEYDYQLGSLLSSDASSTDAHSANVLSIKPGQTSCTTFPPTSNPAVAFSGDEQLSPHMRLVRLDVSPVSVTNPDNLWKINVTVAYGDNDLLCDNNTAASAPGSCAGSQAFGADDLKTFPAGDTLTCRNGAGSSFCAVSSLSTIVQQRLVPED